MTEKPVVANLRGLEPLGCKINKMGPWIDFAKN